jgi:tRNA(fMet)-specific endonuclease VapC
MTGATRHLLAEDFCIDVLTRHPAAFAQKFDRLPFGQVVMSAVTLGSLMTAAQGLSHAAEALETIEAFARLVPSLPWDTAAARAYAELSARLGGGQPADPALRMAAAHALSHGMTLVTRDFSTYTRVPKLRVEDWSR